MSASLWDFSLRFYERPGVAEACLSLQDSCGADVNLVLFALWSGWRGRRVDGAALAVAEAAVRDWQDAIVAPLRGVRRRLKSPDAPAAHEALRLRIKACELEAERCEQEILGACPVGAASAEPGHVLAGDNLRSYLDTLAVPAPAHQVDALVEAVRRLDEAAPPG